ncbi:hypothetical protein AB6A40_008359 [Gnathostoma spinigerum]|uniref:Major facilitator superfamily (MFS) profile domain-containing protein n=1 Tax=Gnathostoma spinigerum TaxID=75299 RepID=A0ABD6ENV4_9BILA
MNWFTVAGVLTQLQDYFIINDSQAGLLQTMFIVCYMLFAPVFGYFGDRYNRRYILSVGLFVWIISVLSSSLVGRENFGLFMLCRAVVGVGEASYSTVAPTIIADMFTGRSRSISLMIFYFAIPVGSGLGYMVASFISAWTGSWQWGIRVTPLFGFVCLLLIVFVMEHVERGQAEHAHFGKSSFLEDVYYLFSIRTYLFATAGFTFVVFVVGSVSWWVPSLLGHSWALHHGTRHVPGGVTAEISLVFGLITCLAGLCGVAFGSSLAQMWRRGNSYLRKSDSADCLVCAVGAIIAVPMLFFAIVLSRDYITLCWIFIFLGVTGSCLNWAVNMDLVMKIVLPNRRSTANAIQTLTSHLMGDASSPYIIGLISDALKGDDASTVTQYYALQRALFVPNFVLIGAGAFYLIASYYVAADEKKAEDLMHMPIIIENGNDTAPLINTE